MREPILITGVPRSGTSLVANIIHHSGANGGRMGLNGTSDNPTGLYENGEIITNITKRMLFDMGYDPRGQVRLPGHTIPRVDVSNKVYDIARRQGIKANETWYWKDAKTLLLFGSFLTSFPNAKWVLLKRNLDDIVDSLLRVSFMNERTTVGEWNQYVIHYSRLMEKLKEETDNVREVSYDKIMDENLDELHEVIDWLGLDFDSEYIDKTVIRNG